MSETTRDYVLGKPPGRFSGRRPGYDATASILLALEQKEVSGIFCQEATFGRRHDLIDSGLVLPVMQSEHQRPNLPLVDDVLPVLVEWP